MNIRKAERKHSKIKMALQGPSGKRKTYSSLLLGFGLVGDYSKICIIDSEAGSADLYMHIWENLLLSKFLKPYTPESYISALELAEGGFKCIIIDSLSHCWQYLIDYRAGMVGNSLPIGQKSHPDTIS